MADRNELLNQALNRLCKWRAHFSGWQLGTRTKDDPESQAVRDHRELSMLMRVELSAIAALLIKAGVFTLDQYQEALIAEARLLERDYELAWPGAKATDDGMSYDVARVKEWMSKWRP